MFHSIREYPSDGVNRDFTANFDLGYISQSHVHVYWYETPAEGELPVLTEIPDTDYTWTDATHIELDVARPAGQIVRLQRITPSDVLLVDYSNGSVVSESNLDTSQDQSIMIAQEAQDAAQLAADFAAGISDIAANAVAIAEEAKDIAQEALDLITASDPVQLKLDLADTSDPLKGDAMVGVRRSAIAAAVGVDTTRTQHKVNNDVVIMATEWPGLDKSGALDSSAAIQAALDGLGAIFPGGATIEFPQGNYKAAGLVKPATGNWCIRGQGNRQTRFTLANDGQAIWLWDDNYAFTSISFENLYFHGAATVNGRGLQCTRVREPRVINCTFEHLAYNVLVDRCRGFIIDDIVCRTSGCWFFHSTVETDYAQNIMVTNVIDPVGTDIKGLYNLDEAWHLKDVVNGNLVNVSYSGLNGTTRFINILGKTEGVFMYACICGFMTVGVLFTRVLYPVLHPSLDIGPQYCGGVNCGFDQPTVSSVVMDGDYNYFTASWMANGFTRNNIGAGVSVNAKTVSARFVDCYIAWHNNDGMVVALGATDIQLRGCQFLQNNKILGANVDLRDQSGYGQLVVRDCTPEMTVFSSNHRIIGGNTSRAVHANVTGTSSTTTTGSIDDLRTFSIPAGTLKVGQRVRIRAWGVSAANTNSKTVRLHFGSLSIGGVTSATSAAHWSMMAEVWITGAATQNADRTGVFGSATNSAQTDLTENTALAIIAKVTGQGGGTIGDVTCKGFTVEIID